MRIACSNLETEKTFPTGLFFTTDGDMRKRELRYRIDNLEILYHSREKYFWSFYYLTDKFLPGSYLHFADIAKILTEHYSKSPRRLEEIAMKTCKRHGVSSSGMTPSVIRNDTFGFILPQAEDNILPKIGLLSFRNIWVLNGNCWRNYKFAILGSPQEIKWTNLISYFQLKMTHLIPNHSNSWQNIHSCPRTTPRTTWPRTARSCLFC